MVMVPGKTGSLFNESSRQTRFGEFSTRVYYQYLETGRVARYCVIFDDSRLI